MYIPTKKDFKVDKGKGCLDQWRVWEHFGGLDIEEAYKKFVDAPEVYQEDFMFMGWKAFKYYLPVFERYFAEVVPDDEFDDCLSWIIGCAFKIQIENNFKDLSPLQIVTISNIDSHIKNRLSKLVNKELDAKVQKKWVKVMNVINRTR